MHGTVLGMAAVLICALSVMPIAGLFRQSPGFLLPLWERAEPFRSVNGYGLFAVMTTSRPEIISPHGAVVRNFDAVTR